MQDMKATVLVVEDDDGIRTLLATILRVAGYEVVAFADGDEALDRLREFGLRIHLLITDVHLGPYMDGMEVAQGLRAFHPSLKVLYISGREDREEMVREVDGGLAAYLAKPFKPSALVEKVTAMLSGVRTAAPAARALP